MREDHAEFSSIATLSAKESSYLRLLFGEIHSRALLIRILQLVVNIHASEESQKQGILEEVRERFSQLLRVEAAQIKQLSPLKF